jgi:[lysine-biosynthesis-protein LysW]---L-2-aminoadipate ligase
MRTPPSLAVLASRVRTEEKLIFTALERCGVSYQYVDTRRFHAALAGGPAAEEPPYAAALSREISHTRAMYAARMLEAAHVPTVNSAEVIATCGDKLLTTAALERAGVRTPRTAVALAPEAGLAAMEQIGFPVVVKPVTGSWGRLAAVVGDPQTARTVLEHRAALPSPGQHVIYVQELIRKPDRDIRVIVIGGEVLGAIYRRGPDWRTNVARNAVAEPCPVTPELTSIVTAAAAAVTTPAAAVAGVPGDPADAVLGVDLVEDPDGLLYVLEVNHTVEFQGFRSAHGDRIDVAGAIAGHMRRHLVAV